LFGNATVLPNGQTAANGFAALAALDTNGDGVINSSDAGWSNLKVWVGESAAGSVQGGQLESLASLGIVQLNLSYTNDATMNNGNIIGEVSSYLTSDGKSHEMADVWFLTSPATTTDSIAALTTAQIVALSTTQLAALTTTQIGQSMSTAQIASLTTAEVVALSSVQIASLSTAQVGALTTAQITALATTGRIAALTTVEVSALTTTQIAALTPPQVSALVAPGGLQSQVGGLAQAIGSFNALQSTALGTTGTSAINSQPGSSVATGLLGVSVNVSGMVGALQQFGLNANPVAAVNSVSTATSLTLSPLPNTTNTGILTSGK
jgi:hypothetical protein